MFHIWTESYLNQNRLKDHKTIETFLLHICILNRKEKNTQAVNHILCYRSFCE